VQIVVKPVISSLCYISEYYVESYNSLLQAALEDQGLRWVTEHSNRRAGCPVKGSGTICSGSSFEFSCQSLSDTKTKLDEKNLNFIFGSVL
jgi:hypothetical protein